MRLAVVAVLLVGCAGTFGERTTGHGALGHVNRIGTGLAALSIACDWGQTHAAARAGWVEHSEGNPIMGDHPSTTVVNVYMAAVLASSLAIGTFAVPSRLRPLFYGAIIAVQANTIHGNFYTTPGLCGFNGREVRAP